MLPYLYNSNGTGTNIATPRFDTGPLGVETSTKVAGC